MCLGVGLFGFILFRVLWDSWRDVCFLLRVKKFSNIISSDKFSSHFFLFSPSTYPLIWMLFCLMLSHRSLKLSFLCKNILFLLLLWVSATALSPHSQILSLPRLVCYWIPQGYFSVKLLCSLALWLLFGTFLYIHCLCWKTDCVHPFFSQVWWALLWP